MDKNKETRRGVNSSRNVKTTKQINEQMVTDSADPRMSSPKPEEGRAWQSSSILQYASPQNGT